MWILDNLFFYTIFLLIEKKVNNMSFIITLLKFKEGEVSVFSSTKQICFYLYFQIVDKDWESYFVKIPHLLILQEIVHI